MRDRVRLALLAEVSTLALTLLWIRAYVPESQMLDCIDATLLGIICFCVMMLSKQGKREE
jgi:hypothetical protein